MPVKYEIVPGKLGQILESDFTNPFRFGYVCANGTVMPEYFREFGDRVQNMNVRDDDLWVCSFPKTGTTWTQEMVWCIGNNLDFEAAQQPLPERFPFLDHTPLFDYRDVMKKIPDFDVPDFALDSISYIDNMPSPRYIKTHLSWQLLPQQIQNGTKKPKIIYVARNAKDTCVSYYHHCKLLEGYKGTFEDYVNLFLDGKLCFAPFWNNVLGYWNQRHKDNVLFIKYEDMKKDLPSVVKQVADFMGKTLTDNQLETLCDHLSFESMKNNKSVNYESAIEINKKYGFVDVEGSFMRSGTVGSYKGTMPADIIDKFNEWTDNHLKGSGLVL